MVRYWLYITQIKRLPIRQYVFYIGNEPLSMPNKIYEPMVKYEYGLLDMRDVDCEKFLYSERPQEMVISILCNFQTKGVTIYLKELLHRIKGFVREETVRGKYIRQIEVLSQLRDIQGDVSKEVEDMALIFDIEKDIRFKQGLEKGLEQGLLEGIELALDIKFGGQGLALMEKIKDIDDLVSLKLIKEHIRTSASISELVDLINLS
ncbi:MAG: hypothetical protein HQL06_14510 [Nitrospirae bacterium]|nr:hypothetical protein [Nitrospirota bacterium]